MEEELIRNAGNSLGDGLAATTSTVGLKYTGGQNCISGANQTVQYTTNIDFICQQVQTSHPCDEKRSVELCSLRQEEDSQSGGERITYVGTVDECTSQVYWFTSLGCLPAQKEAVETGSCVLDIPGPDIRIDLAAWASETFLTAESQPGEEKRSFQLNLCRPAVGSLCGDKSMVCEVDDTWQNMKNNLIAAEPVPVKLASYDELREVITLRYIAGTAKVFIDIECDAAATEPEVRLVHHNGSEVTFSMKTAKACFVPVRHIVSDCTVVLNCTVNIQAVHCHAESQTGDIFNFENLLASEWDFATRSADNRTFKYQIKVCGALPIIRSELGTTNPYPCHGQTGICYFEETDSRVSEPVSLGVMSQPPTVNEDGSISMLYEGGDRSEGHNCSRSAEIVFRCELTEAGPQHVSDDGCRHLIHWNTPESCPATKTVTADCAIREPLYSHLFNLSSLHNPDSDYQVSHDGQTFILNPCGHLRAQDCSHPQRTCFSRQVDLSYDSDLKLHLESESSCRERPDQKISAVVEFLCHHEAGLGSPAVFTEEEGCRYRLEWLTSLACPPHDIVQCSVDTGQGEIDLTSLSLPRDNYQVSDQQGREYIINICRSIVHTSKSHCPYKSAACFTSTERGQVTATNLGQVSSGLEWSEEDQQAFIRYRLGSACQDKATNRSHLETIIYFHCAPGLFDSRPELVDVGYCLYTLQWRHAAACPVKKVESGNCSITDPATGFTYDLNSLEKTGGDYKWSGSYHHIQGAFDFNICGRVNSSKCEDGAGVCSKDGKTNLGRANRELAIEEGQIYLNYTDGSPCEGGQKMFTVINLICPYDRLNSPSGNYETLRQKYQVKRMSRCQTVINFPTELACDHQVNCQLSSDGSVFSLDKLRRHQDNYHVANVDPSKPEFVLNICGPLVAADVASPDCNPHSVCSRQGGGGRYLGLGKAVSSPHIEEDGNIVLEYRGGEPCSTRGDQARTWRSRVIFTCGRSAATAEHPFGLPQHISTDPQLCSHTFRLTTVLVCPDLYETKEISEPDSCKIFHTGVNRYIDISPLRRAAPYTITVDPRESFEIQPCGQIGPSCPGAICHLSPTSNHSMGHLTDFTYQPALDSIRVNYKEVSHFHFQAHQTDLGVFSGSSLQPADQQEVVLQDLLHLRQEGGAGQTNRAGPLRLCGHF